MKVVVITKQFGEPPFREREILRYAGYKIVNIEDVDAETRALMEACLVEVAGKLEYKVCYHELAVSVHGDVCDFGAFQVASKNLATHLQGYNRVILFAATVGVGIDRLIRKYSVVAPSKALLFQAIGAERIEALCDAFCEELREMCGAPKVHRFSPGYGDLPLETQRDVFAVLECEKKIGLTLNDSLLMSPTKSVTAFVGIK